MTEKKEDELVPKKETFNKEEADKKLNFVMDIIHRLTGGDTVSGKIYPVLDPKNWKTTSVLREGQIYSILAMITLYNQEPKEAYPCLDWAYNLCLLSLSRDGFGIMKAIDLGKALTEKGVSQVAPYKEPEKPTEGMKQSE